MRCFALEPPCQIVKVKDALARLPDLGQIIANMLKGCRAACQRNAIPVECPVQFVAQLSDAWVLFPSRTQLDVLFEPEAFSKILYVGRWETMPARSAFDRIRNLRIECSRG